MLVYVVDSSRGDMDLVVGMGVFCVDCDLAVGIGFCSNLLHGCCQFALAIVDSSCLVVFGGIVLLKDVAGVL